MLKASRILRAAEWSKTLNLPTSSLPPRALVAHRPSYIKQCADDLYQWQAHARSADNQFVLADGPPYANGSLHVGHALNKILKDIICRFQLSAGKRVHYRPGWDCHGLPIEIKALQSQDAHTRLHPVEIRDVARRLATAAVEEQKQGFRGWGIMGDWDNAWQTMHNDFELRQLEVFKQMVKKGLVYRQFKPVYWSPSSGTALAEAELEYDEHHVSRAAYVKFQLVVLPDVLRSLQDVGHVYALIWTTTPWTLPANSAIAVHEQFEYCVFKVKTSSDMILVATTRLEEVLKAANLTVEDVDIVMNGVSGSQLAGKGRYINTLRGTNAPNQPIIHANFVTDSSGSGLVHLAPGHGFEDYDVCRQLGIDILAPVDDHGCFTEAAYPAQPELLRGKEVFKSGSEAVITILRDVDTSGGLVWAIHDYKHKYPIDWRTKQPLIIRATAQWFADVELIKGSAIRSLEDVTFYPATSKTRLESFIAGRSLWCISRQRAWGVPIPALYTSVNGQLEAVMTPDSVSHIIQMIAKRGIDAWWTDAPEDSAWVAPTLPKCTYIRGRDTMDVWFDSGTSWAMLPNDRSPPADVYIEGTDQHRGWFQSSLLTYIAHQTATNVTTASPNAPFKTLITHGFTLDQEGRKMSKSIGNVISPEQVMDGTLLGPMKKRKGQKARDQPSFDAMGPDALRLWVASSDHTRDVIIGQTVLQAANTNLHKYRVTFKWLLGVLKDYTLAHFAASEASPVLGNIHLIDRLAIHQLARIKYTTYTAYAAHEPFKAVTALNRYVTQDLSAFYVEAAKDPLYADDVKNQVRAQHTCYNILQGLLQMLAPTLPLLVTEVVDHASESLKQVLTHPHQDPFKSVWLLPTLSNDADLMDEQLRWLNAAFDAVKIVQEEARAQKKMGTGLQCHVLLQFAPQSELQEEVVRFFFNAATRGDLTEIFVVSSVKVNATSSSSEDGLSNMASPPAWRFERDFEIPMSSTNDLGAASTALKGHAIVLPPDMAKCPRCWRYTAPPPLPFTPSQDETCYVEQKLCGRCEDVVRELNAKSV